MIESRQLTKSGQSEAQGKRDLDSLIKTANANLALTAIGVGLLLVTTTASLYTAYVMYRFVEALHQLAEHLSQVTG